MRIVIPGGNGQVGRLLARHFHSAGHTVTVLSRRPMQEPWQTLVWDGRAEGPWVEALKGADVCINLAGRSVNTRYTPGHQREMYESRIRSTRVLQEAIASLAHPPRVWLNASTATIYRHALDRPMDEETGELGGNERGAPAKWNYSVKIARDWEAAFFSSAIPRVRKVAMRSAITLNADRGSVFEILSRLARWGLGGSMGSGRQFVSWIHEDDFVRAVEFLIADSRLSGSVNLASPHPLPNREFMRALREAWRSRIGLPATAWMIEIGSFVMRSESELVLKSRRVVPIRLLKAGFHFEFPEWPAAAEDLVQRWREKFVQEKSQD